MRIPDVLLDVGVSRMFVSRWPVAVALVRPTLPHPAGAASHSWCVVQVIACRITASVGYPLNRSPVRRARSRTGTRWREGLPGG